MYICVYNYHNANETIDIIHRAGPPGRHNFGSGTQRTIHQQVTVVPLQNFAASGSTNPGLRR